MRVGAWYDNFLTRPSELKPALPFLANHVLKDVVNEKLNQ